MGLKGSLRNVSTEVPAIPVAYSNLVAWYPFDSDTYGGSNADDVTAIIGGSGDDTAYDGTVNGASYESAGGVTDLNAGASSGYYEQLSGNYVEFGIKGSDIVSPFSIMFWWKGTDTGYSHSTFGTFPAFYFRDKGGTLTFKDEQGSSDEAGTGSIPQNQWTHIAVVVGPTDVNHYIDGQNVFTHSGEGHSGKSYNNLEVSQGILRPGDKRPWEGDYDDTRIYNTDLSGSQINQIYLNADP